jgi:hypothetical protein
VGDGRLSSFGYIRLSFFTLLKVRGIDCGGGEWGVGNLWFIQAYLIISCFFPS